MPSYGQFCPVSQALDIVGERWSLLIIRELLCGDYRFGELLKGLPLISRSLLSQRLKDLEAAGLIERRELASPGHAKTSAKGAPSSRVAYGVSEAGRELEPIVLGLGQWGKRWVQRKFNEEELDPVLLMWDVRRRLDAAHLPEERTLVEFWFRDLSAKKSRYWLDVEPPEIELCLTHPGREVALRVETTLPVMVDVWMGRKKLREAMLSKAIECHGPSRLKRDFPSWLLLNNFANES
jgi:DNA-binding HxlR family transcriptional regulator